jgi:hypothetical protein
MGTCAFCKSLILFGGRTDGGNKYCNDKCQQRAAIVAMSATIPPHVVQEHVWAVHQGACPRCRGKGPIDVHMLFRVWSALILTSWSNNQQVSCRACAVKTQIVAIAGCLVLGWWGIPWGLLMTPVQVTRNVIALMKAPDPTKPSPRLESFVRMSLAQEAMAQQKTGQTATTTPSRAA